MSLPAELIPIILKDLKCVEQEFHNLSLVSKQFRLSLLQVSDLTFIQVELLAHIAKNNLLQLLKVVANNPTVNLVNPVRYFEGKIREPKTKHSFMLRVACGRGYVDMVKYLIAVPNMDSTVENNAPLRMAINGNFTEIVKLLLIHSRIKVSDELMHMTVLQNCPQIVEAMLPLVPQPKDNLMDSAFYLKYEATILVLLDDPRLNPMAFEGRFIQKATEWKNKEILAKIRKHPKYNPTEGIY